MNAWTALGLGIGTLGVILTVAFAIFSRRPKRLSYTSQITPIRIPHDIGLTVQYKDTALTAPHVVTVRIANTGKVEIRSEDFAGPLEINLPETTRVITAGVIGSAERVNPEVAQQREDQVVLFPLLINPGEWFDLQLLTDGSGAGKTMVEGRIAGARLTDLKDRSRRRAMLKAVGRFAEYRVLSGLVASLAVGLTAATLPLALAREVDVPDLTGRPVAEAVDLLRLNQLHLGDLTTIPSPRPAGTVLDQHPSPGEGVTRGSQVSVVVAEPPLPRE